MATSRKAKISLTSVSVDIYPLRTLVVSIGHPVQVGRASSNITRNILPHKDNAVYEAAVVSRFHASFFMDETDNQVYIRDMNSSHGTFVNGHAIKGPTALHLGDSIIFGSDIRHRDHGLARSHVVQISSLEYYPYKPNSYGLFDDAPACDEKHQGSDCLVSLSKVPDIDTTNGDSLEILNKCADSASDNHSPSHAPLRSDEKTSGDVSDGDSTESEYEELNQQDKEKEIEGTTTPHTSPVSAPPDSTQSRVCRIVNAIGDQYIRAANSMPSTQALLPLDETPHTSQASASPHPTQSREFRIADARRERRMANAIKDQDIQEANSMPSTQALLSLDETLHSSQASASPHPMRSRVFRIANATRERRIVTAIRDQGIQEVNSMPSVQALLSFDEALAEPDSHFDAGSSSGKTIAQSCQTPAVEKIVNIPSFQDSDRQSSSPSSLSSHYQSSIEAQSKNYTVTNSAMLPFEPMPLDFKFASLPRTSSIGWKSRAGVHLGRTSMPNVQRSDKQSPISKGGIIAKSTETSPSPSLQRMGMMHTMSRPRHVQLSPSTSIIDGERMSWQVLVDLASLLNDQHSDCLSHDRLISKAITYWETRDIYIRSDRDVSLEMFLQKHWDLLFSDLKSLELKLENMLGRRDEISFGENIRLPEIVFELSNDALVEKSLNQLCSWEGIAFQSIHQKRVIPLLTYFSTWTNGSIVSKATAYIQHYKTLISPNIIKENENELIHVPRILKVQENPKQIADIDSRKRKREPEELGFEADTIDVSTTTEEMLFTEPPMKKRNVGVYIWTGVAGVLVGGIGTIAALIASANDIN
ncbi:Vacuolar protein sorting-associated protein 64 [Neolecta irregularis DAH-3]|uniref:Vacuolar protein sorting-associated protein 64 n=1 Tax=Neolecta irregularis (strain DAH-3) TaxID=1198029 RepID=A0A1U7LKS8_NEOID|nr:Vacuolar protein sorting-associated protein 64 [Neolecta irregularis DAH-3]|eukprot:OLL23266.1 Vacuolar protein sorting-associated protein 64 [Neolecta irregularis DAH-3]